MVKTAYVTGTDLGQVQTKVNNLLTKNEIAETRVISINSHLVSTNPKSPLWGATIFWREKSE